MTTEVEQLLGRLIIRINDLLFHLSDLGCLLPFTWASRSFHGLSKW